EDASVVVVVDVVHGDPLFAHRHLPRLPGEGRSPAGIGLYATVRAPEQSRAVRAARRLLARHTAEEVAVVDGDLTETVPIDLVTHRLPVPQRPVHRVDLRVGTRIGEVRIVAIARHVAVGVPLPRVPARILAGLGSPR